MRFIQSNSIEKIYPYLVILFISLIPLYFYLNNFAAISSPYVRGIKDILLVGVSIIGIIFVPAKRQVENDIIFLIAIFLYVVINTFLISGISSDAFFAMRSYLLLPILTILTFTKLDNNELQKVYIAFIYSAGGLAVIHLIQVYLFKDFLVLGTIAETYSKGSFLTRPASFVNNPNTLAYMNVIAIIIAVFLRRVQLLIPVLIVSTLLTGCRTAILLGPIAIIITYLIKNKINVVSLIITMVTAVIIVSGLSKYFPVIFERISILINNGDPRLVMWESVINYLAENNITHLLFGLGIGKIGTYGTHVNTIPVYIPGVSDLDGLAFVDNYYLMTIIESGLLFFVFYCVYLLFCLIKAISKVSASMLYRCNVALVIFILFISLVADVINSFPISFFFYGIIFLTNSREPSDAI